jgi:NAD(P)-dependent dehydrogenase (short-subunit alcohol dehydrogenase family)
MFRLDNKIALVTGASRGIGRATALALANAGAKVLVHYGKSAADAESVVEVIKKSGGQAELLGADLASPDGPLQLVSEVRKIAGGRLDILVLNAGVSKAARIENHTVDEFDNLFATNVRAPFFVLQQLLPILGDGSSVVVNTSLAARATAGDPGKPGAPSLSAYAATKGALETMVKHWAAELGGRGIRVNAVAPGVIATDMSSFTKTDGGRELALNMQALKRIGQPEDVADVIAFVASDGARWITGASIPADGGSKL